MNVFSSTLDRIVNKVVPVSRLLFRRALRLTYVRGCWPGSGQVLDTRQHPVLHERGGAIGARQC